MDSLILPRVLCDELLEQARRSLPAECCGVLGGQGNEVSRVFPATNELASPTTFEVPARQLFEIFRQLRADKLDLVGIYHSHPSGENTPSARDLERAYYPEAAFVILSPGQDAPQPVRAFSLAGGEVRELPVEIAD